MKNICLIEPIGVSKEIVEKLAKDLINENHNFTYYETKADSVEELIKRSENQDVIIISNTNYPEAVIKKATNLEMISVAFTGVDHIDNMACEEQKIMICNASGYANEAVAELVIGMAISALREIVDADKMVRAGGSGIKSGREIAGKTVGIIGLGKIGLRTAELFSTFGAKIIAYNNSKSQKAIDMGIEYKTLDEVLAQSDIISLNLPLTSQTKSLISTEKIALMKKQAILINCARGPIIDNVALASALNNDQIGYACIDVFDIEPPIPDDYPLLHAKNTLFTPHIGFDTEEAMIVRAEIAFQNVKNYLAGTPTNICE